MTARSLPTLLLLTSVVYVALSAGAGVVAAGEHTLSPSPIAIEVANLQEQLNDGLRARLPAEFAFVARVVVLVEEGRLPLVLVKSTFQWARRKKPFPFPYFEHAMRIQAAQLGVAI